MNTNAAETTWFDGAPLGQLVYDRTYSRKLHTEDCEQLECSCPKETWLDTVTRVVDGNINFVDAKFIEPGERDQLFNLLLNRQFIPAGRHLWVTGVEGRAFTQNCHVAGFETGLAEHCSFVFSELMKGGGVGANYSSRYLDALTPLSSVEVRFLCDPSHADYDTLLPLLSNNYSTKNEIVIRVPDSREGWVAALQLLIETATKDDGTALVFDVSGIRCQGSPIRGFGGISSGPWPLVKMLHSVSLLLPSEVTPELTMEIDHLIAGAVIAGNVRRSARMSVMHWNDPRIDWFLNCKADHQHHWSTNISVEVDKDFFHALAWGDEHAQSIYERVIEGMVNNGEPGFYNSSLASKGERTHIGSTNPCGEMPLESWESCNLGHVNLAFGTDADHRNAFRLMARFLLRATHCDIQDPKQRSVVEANRRIGVGFFGLQEWLALRGIKYSKYQDHGILQEALQDWYKIVREESDRYADEMGVNRPIKCTTLAPTGTIAKLAGTSEGMQSIYAKYYLRRVRYSENDPEVANLRSSGVPLEPCIYSPNTLVASFPCEDPILTRVPGEYVEEQHEIDLEVLLGIQALVQRYYADNAISLTINIPDGSVEDAERLKDSLKRYLPHIKGTTVFPEASRPQSPIERISKQEYEAMVRWQTINSGTSEIMEDACQGGSCPVR